MEIRSPWLLLIVVVGCGSEIPPATRTFNAREVTLIPDEPNCRDCEIEFRELAVLGADSDPASIRSDAMRGCMVGQLATGEYLVSGIVGGGQLLVYAEVGGGARRTIGRRGQGPGELSRNFRLVIGPLDTLHVFDDGNGRLQVLTPTGDFVRSFPTPSSGDPIALLTNGDHLFHTFPMTEDDALFTIVRPTGEERARFGKPFGPEFDLDQWIVGAAPAGEFWAASIWKYEMHRWTGSGSIVRTVMREAPWFADSFGTLTNAEVAAVYRTRPPPPFLRHIWEDSTGLLWAYTQVPDPMWEPGLAVRMTPEWGRRTFDTVVEAIDLELGRVVARGRSDELLGAVCGSRLMYLIVETEMGNNRVVVVDPIVIGSIEGGAEEAW